MQIPLSEKHGLNPSLLVCPFCFRETNGLALVGRLPHDAEAPKYMIDQELCSECKELKEKGFVLRERNGEYLTGRLWVITHEAAQKIFVDADLSFGMAYIEGHAARKIGLPMGEENVDAD